ncbi:putative MFS-type transporter YusP [Zancudomyces culisetae]|uniref:Putative MFS-type transporter YusP n=1 Tax=Zancudomyces culisetae TaxID=1213189 RepID=A0A1R1PZ20_ZANCU|nr:putative MFS-type transporter YusP [Zancudomyces culisetae]|eukprot:OMH86184.1 putative MFS-type transporter YusP [Zancudomyces culisetae]
MEATDTERSFEKGSGTADIQNRQLQVEGDHGEVLENTGEKAEQPSSKSLAVIVLGLGTAMFLASLDSTIVSTAMPTIAQNFNSLSMITWVATSYMLTSTALQPLYGTLSDIFGKKTMLLFCIIVFELASLGCGLSHNMIMLIIFRGVAGVGGAGIFVMVTLCISQLVPIRERGKYMGILGAVFGLSSVLGPLLGGLFTDKVSWRWCFYINLPLAALCIPTVMFLIKMERPKGGIVSKLKRIDLLGALVFVAGCIMILLALTWGGTTYSWSSGIILGMLLGGFAILVVFVFIELKVSREPMIKMELFVMRNPVLLFSSQFCAGVGMYSLIYYIPIYYHTVYNGSATKQGLFLLPMMLSLVVGSVGSGWVSSKTGKYRILIWIGMAIFSVGVGLFLTLKLSTSRAVQNIFMIIAGFGLGMAMQLMTIAIQACVPLRLVTGATTLITFCRVIGGTIGLAIASAVYNTVVKSKLADFSAANPDYSKLASSVMNNSSLAFSSGVPLDIREKISQCFMSGVHSVFLVSTPFACIGFFALLFLKSYPMSLGVQDSQKTTQEVSEKTAQEV